MDAYALVTMKYLDTNHQKATAPAGSVFADFNEGELEPWITKGYVRKATVGEVAEAKAAGAYRGGEASEAKPSLRGKASEAKPSRAATSTKKSDQKSQKAGEGTSGNSGDSGDSVDKGDEDLA